MLRAHIHKEDAILYPMAEQHLPAEAMAEVSLACDRYEGSAAQGGEPDRLRALAEELIRTHAAAVHPPEPRGCCG